MNNVAAKFFTSRGIDPETADRAGITSENSGSDTVIIFPFLEHGNTVNRKFRGAGKRFWQDKDGKKTFWNVDALDAAIEADKPLVITEGEMDALSVIEAGYPYVVSIPDGAPAKLSVVELNEEDDTKFSYVHTNIDKLLKLRKIILAGDNDEPGRILNQELVRRLGAHCCQFVSYPDDCKDFNDILVKLDPKAVRQVIDEAKDYPVKGLYRLSDYPDLPKPTVYSTDIPFMDKHLKLELGRFMVVTGVPGHGKSNFADIIAFNAAMQHGWKCCIATFENAPKPHWCEKLVRKYLKADPDFAGTERRLQAENWVGKNFTFITQNPLEDDEEDLDLDRIIDLAQISVIRHGIKVLVIDPWNEIEHQRSGRETETDYTNRAIRRLKKFARSYNVLVIVVAHPAKMNQHGSVKRPHPYDISGSANWYNKADYCVTVWRPDITKTQVEIHVSKVKNQEYMGKPGVVDLEYDTRSGAYFPAVSGAFSNVPVGNDAS